MINNAADRRLINYFQAYHWADAHHVIAPKRRTIPHWKYCNMKTFYVTAQHHLKWVPYHSNTGKYKVYFWKSWFFFLCVFHLFHETVISNLKADNEKHTLCLFCVLYGISMSFGRKKTFYAVYIQTICPIDYLIKWARNMGSSHLPVTADCL